MTEELQRPVRNGLAIARAIADVGLIALATLSRPLALLTEAFYRKDMGERYFTKLGSYAGLVVLIAFTVVSRWIETLIQWFSKENIELLKKHVIPPVNLTVVNWVGGVWFVAFLLAYAMHRQAVRKRHKAGVRWHSGNSGVPRLPLLTLPVQYTLTMALCVAAFFFDLYVFGTLLALSLLCSAISERIAATRFWNSVLDVIDAEIESEHLSRAVSERLTPGNVEGLEAPVPAYVSAESRQRIAAAFGGQSKPEIVVKENLLGKSQVDSLGSGEPTPP